MAGNGPQGRGGVNDWTGTLWQLKQAISHGITERRISDEFFVFDLLKGVCEDGVEEITRIQLLNFLEENGTILIDLENVEQVMASLLDIYQQGRKTGASGGMSTQILTTLTTLVVNFDQMNEDVAISRQIVATLLEIISHVNDTSDLLLRSHACLCLLELELAFPTLLVNKLEPLYGLIQLEKSSIFQDYVHLFCQILHHALVKLTTSETRVAENTITDILCNRRESLKEFPDLQKAFGEILKSCLQSELEHLDGAVDTRELRQVLSLFMDHCVVFTPAGLSSIIRLLIKIVLQLPTLSPIIFKPLLLQHMSTMDISLLQLILRLKRSFTGVLLSDQEEKLLLQYFMVSINQPVFTPGHRLLLYQWLINFEPTTQNSPGNNYGLPVRLEERQKGQLFPCVFDGVDTQVVKLRSLSLCIHPGIESDLSSAVLMSSVVHLHKTVQYNASGRAAVALFRVLFAFYRHHIDSCLTQDLKQLIIGMVSHSVQLVPHTINFLDCLVQLPNSRGAYLTILTALHKQVIQAPIEDIISQLDFVLQVLQKAVTERQINPKMTVNFLQKLLNFAPQLSQGSWVYGNAVLVVGRNILQHHSTDLIYNDMGRLFHSMMMIYKDVDIKDKAKFYYALLTGAADEKIGLVLTDSTSKHGTTNNQLHNIVSGPGGFLNQTTLVELETSPVSWQRLSHCHRWSPGLPLKPEQYLSSPKDCVVTYLKLLKQHEVCIEFLYRLNMVESCEFEELLALTVQLETNSHYKPCTDVHISCLSKSETKDICVKMTPISPMPAEFTAEVMFTSTDSRTYTCHLESTAVQFSHCFVPLPLSLSCTQDAKAFFDTLWQEIVTENDDPECCGNGVESVYCAKLDMAEMETILQRKFQPYVIASNTVERTHLVGMFLPARHHLLMRIEEVEGRVIIRTATDLWNILTILQTYLGNLTSFDHLG